MSCQQEWVSWGITDDSDIKGGLGEEPPEDGSGDEEGGDLGGCDGEGVGRDIGRDSNLEGTGGAVPHGKGEGVDGATIPSNGEGDAASTSSYEAILIHIVFFTLRYAYAKLKSYWSIHVR